jgi:hypothetical protein
VGFPMVPMVCFAHGFPRVFPTFPRVFRFLRFSYGFHHFFPMVFPMFFQVKPSEAPGGTSFAPGASSWTPSPSLGCRDKLGRS